MSQLEALVSCQYFFRMHSVRSLIYLGLTLQGITRIPSYQPKRVQKIVVVSIDGSTDWRDAPREVRHV
jgi:hypothetical protein